MTPWAMGGTAIFIRIDSQTITRTKDPPVEGCGSRFISVPVQIEGYTTKLQNFYFHSKNAPRQQMNCRHILYRKLVLRKQLKAYGLDTTTHTRCRLCNRTSETLRHLDVCPVVRAVFAQGESLNIQPPRLLTIIGTSADTPEVHNALHLHMWNQIIVSFYEEEDIKPEQTWKAVLNLLVRNMQAYSGEARTRLRRIRRKSDRVSDSTMKEISDKVEPMGTIDYYGRLRLSRRVNDELRRVGLDHLTTEEATARAREIKFVQASQASTSNT